MKVISNQSRKSSQAFTLIEMIGVLAVIAILASMLVPKIFEAINSARINNTVQSYNAIKTAVMDHYGKYGAINILGVPAPGSPMTAGTNEAYDLDGGGAIANDAYPAAFVVEAVIQGVAIADAIEISERLDGATLSVPGGGDDFKGRVKYAGAAVTEVHIYIAHR